MSVINLPNMQVQRLKGNQQGTVSGQGKPKCMWANTAICAQTQCIQLQHHLPPSYATRLPTYSIHHYIALTTATTPSVHAAKHAQLLSCLPPFCCTLSHPMSFLHHCCLHLAMSPPCCTVSATNTHLTIIALQCGLRTPSPLKTVVFNQFCR